MSDTTGTGGGTSSNSKPKRGKDQLPWSTDVWDLVDQAVNDEIARSRVCSKFLQQVYVHKKRVNVESDVVIVPQLASTGPSSVGAATSVVPTDMALSVEESDTTKIYEYSVQMKLSPAQVEAEGKDENLHGKIQSKIGQIKKVFDK